MGLLPLTNDQITDRLRQENPWWATGGVDEDYLQMQKRLYFELFYPLVEDISIKRAVILMGPRRVGKTVLLYHTIDALIKHGINPHQIAYISIENPFFNKIPLEQLFKTCLKAHRQSQRKGLLHFF
jgi:predicted AAA+ superfamily ATPase